MIYYAVRRPFLNYSDTTVVNQDTLKSLFSSKDGDENAQVFQNYNDAQFFAKLTKAKKGTPADTEWPIFEIEHEGKAKKILIDKPKGWLPADENIPGAVVAYKDCVIKKAYLGHFDKKRFPKSIDMTAPANNTNRNSILAAVASVTVTSALFGFGGGIAALAKAGFVLNASTLAAQVFVSVAAGLIIVGAVAGIAYTAVAAYNKIAGLFTSTETLEEVETKVKELEGEFAKAHKAKYNEELDDENDFLYGLTEKLNQVADDADKLPKEQQAKVKGMLLNFERAALEKLIPLKGKELLEAEKEVWKEARKLKATA